jgi:hypothetical protein
LSWAHQSEHFPLEIAISISNFAVKVETEGRLWKESGTAAVAEEVTKVQSSIRTVNLKLKSPWRIDQTDSILSVVLAFHRCETKPLTQDGLQIACGYVASSDGRVTFFTFCI